MFLSASVKCTALSLIVAGLGVAAPRVQAPDPRIAFASHRDGNWEIYVSDPDGGQLRRMTRREEQDRFPLWSPDRSKIAFGSQVGGTEWELWLMTADGAKFRPLASRIVAKGFRQWSHDGTRIVFAATIQGDIEIASVEIATSMITRLTTSPGEDRDPSWSPDDRRIVFSSTRDGNAEIYLMRADGSTPRRLTNDGAADESPAWSPDGSRIAFVSARDGGRDLYLMRPEDGRVERLTVDAQVTRDMPRWSPDGAYIAIQTAAKSNYDIQLVRIADRKRTVVAGTPDFDGQFSWSPEGDRIAFISGRDGSEAVYVTDLTGREPKRLTTTASLNPEWAPGRGN